MRIVAVTAMLLLASCAYGGLSRRLPDRIQNLPWSDAPADQSVLRARALAARGAEQAALELVATVLAAQPRHVDGNRVRQDILRGRGRRGLLLHEAEARLTADPDDALAWYLRGRVAFAERDKRRCFERAVELAPRSMWGWLGLAHTLRLRQPERSLAIYERLYAATDAHPIVAIAWLQVLQRRGLHQRQVQVAATLAADQRVPGIGALAQAQALIASEERELAWQALLEAVRLRPFDAAVQQLVGAWLEAGVNDEQVDELFDLLRQDPVRLQQFGDVDGGAVLVELLERHRQPVAALEWLRRNGVTARRPALRRTERRLLLAVGDVAGFLALLRADLPRPVLAAEPNRLRGRWLRLLDGPWHDGEPLASPARAAALLQALLDTGLVVEAEQVADVALGRFGGSPELVALRDEARAELAFEGGVRRLLYRGYRAGDTADLAVVIDRLRELSRRTLGRDVVGEPPRFEVPWIGEMVDPFVGGLSEHLARYNRHFVLGRRAGGVAEGMLLTRLSLADLPPDVTLSLPGRCLEVVAFDRDVRTLTGVVGGDIAGVALLHHFVIDFDAVREWAGSIAERRQVMAKDGDALLSDPLPVTPGIDPVDVAWRLAALSPVQDTDLELAVLDMIRHHERRHLVDSFDYLPISANLGRGVSLMFRFGLSAAAIEAEMERRAELAALVVSPHTELVLAHIADFLPDPGAESPHHRGFSALAEDLEARLRQLGVAPAAAAPSGWYELDRELVREAARDLLGRLR